MFLTRKSYEFYFTHAYFLMKYELHDLMLQELLHGMLQTLLGVREWCLQHLPIVRPFQVQVKILLIIHLRNFLRHECQESDDYMVLYMQYSDYLLVQILCIALKYKSENWRSLDARIGFLGFITAREAWGGDRTSQ